MKINVILVLIFLLSASGYSQPPKLFIYLVSHNEDNIGYDNVGTGSTLWYNNRDAFVDVVNTIQLKNAKLNYGADYVALQAIAEYDTGTVLLNTNGKNFVKWLFEDMGVECDAHSHESAYNYADVHYLMTLLGITPTNTMSGYLYDQPQSGNYWDTYQLGVVGDSFPSYTFYPEILWGGATPGHVSDPHFFGVFKPQSMAAYFTHESANNLIAVGTGCPLKLENTTTIEYVDSLMDKIVSDIQSGVLPQDGIYTQEIFFSEGKVNQPWFFPLLNKVIDSVNVHVGEGTVEWKHITEIADYWETTFLSQPFAVDCDYTLILGGENYFSNSEMLVYPNPVSNWLTIELPNGINSFITIYDQTGRVLNYQTQSGKAMIDFSELAPGIYFVRIAEKGVVKVVKN